jgi:hypothetical protein
VATQLTRFTLEQGGSVVVEVDAPPGTGMDRVGRTADAVREAGATLEKALGDVQRAATETLAKFQSMARPPSEVQLSFGVKIDAQVGAVLAKTGAEGHFEVTLTWKPES